MFSVYEWSKCAFAQHALLVMEGLIEKMRHIYPLNRRHVFIPLVLFVALAVGFLLLPPFPGGFAQAQDASNIPYQENGAGPVTTFTATDPEGGTVYWSLAVADVTEVDGIGAGDEDDFSYFSISSRGVLSFKFSPDYEMPRGMAIVTANTNTYRVVVVASDDALGAEGMMGYKKVTVTVTNLDEPGEITFSSQQPQVAQPFDPTLADQDASTSQIGAAEWEWEQASSLDGEWSVIVGATTESYTPVSGLVDKYLRATATYTDEHGSGKTAIAVSAHKIRMVPSNNVAPVDPAPTDTEDTDTTRVVDENSPPGTNVGKPVTASDTAGDVLTYTLADNGNGDGANYSIDPGTGQITVGARTTLDADDNASDSVTVMATDPSGLTGEIEVTITIRDINEVPTITEGPTRVTLAENPDITADISTYTYEATDPESADVNDACDMDNCSLSLQGSDAGDFSISNESGTYGASHLQGSTRLRGARRLQQGQRVHGYSGCH